MTLRRHALLVTALALTTAGPAGAQAQHGQGHGHQHGGRDDAPAHHRVEACQREFDAVVADGRGFGLAFPADQNGYPGPLHVLELKDQLRLTPEQETRMRALFETMLTEARSRAARLAAAETRLRQVFVAGAADTAAVRAAVAETETARAEVLLVHLLTHVQTRDVLTDTQRRTYHEIRWGSRKNH
jgi:Spy/CpxP family protein refolding chaperone